MTSNCALAGVVFDFLAKPIDVGFERMGRDIRLVAPDFSQRDATGDDFGAGAIKETQDRGLLFGQAQLGALVVLTRCFDPGRNVYWPIWKTASSLASC